MDARVASRGPDDRRMMLMALAEVIDDLLKRDEAESYGFALVVHPMERDGDCEYLSNGLSPEQTAALLSEMINRARDGMT